MHSVQTERHRNRSRLEAAYTAHSDAVRIAALAVTRSHALADDVVQEVFLSLWLHPDRFDPERGSIASYLRMLARSRALDALRAAGAAGRAHDRLRAEHALHPGAEPDALEVVHRQGLARAVRESMRELPREQREAVVLTYWGGLTSAQVARRSGVAVGTAKSRVRLGLRKLAQDGTARRELEAA